MPEKYTPRLSREKRRRYASELAVDLSKNDRPVFGTEKNEQERNESQEQFNAERAKLKETVLSNPNLEKILGEKPVFYKKERGRTEYSLEPDFQHLAHDDEFRKMVNNPLEYINRLLPIYRGKRSWAELPKGKSVKELLSVPYDISRVKIMEAGGNKYVVKRVDEKKVQHDLEEYDLTKKAHEIGIPGPKPVGIIKSKGNTFLIFEYLENTTNLDEIIYRREDNVSFSQENELVATISTQVLPSPIIRDRRWSKQADKINTEFVFADKFDEQRGLWRDLKRLIDKLDHISDSKDSLEDIFLTLSFLFSRLREGLMGKENKLYENIFGINFDNLPDVEFIVKDGRPLYKFKGLAESESQILLKDTMNDCIIKIEKNWEKLIAFRNKVINEKNILYESAVPVYEREHFGVSISVPYKKFIKMVKEKCAQNGIKHKDLEYRNVLTKIDPETGAIEPDKDGNAQFYVVDWEQM